MAMLDRYNKKGGFVQLLVLLETTPSPKHEKFMAMIAEESADWEIELKKKMLSLDRILGWPSQTLMEILPRIPINIVGMAISQLAADKQQAVQNALGHFDKRKVEDTWRETKPTPAEIATCQIKILAEVRTMITAGHLKLEAFDPELIIPPNVEDSLSMGSAGSLGSGYSMGPNAEASTQTPTTVPAPSGSSMPPSNSNEEVQQLKRKLQVLTQENHKLTQQVQLLKDKLEQIRKIA